MLYKSLLTVWDGRPECRAALDAAVDMARAWDSHLNVLCLGIDHVEVGYYYAGASPVVMAENIEGARTEAKKLEAEVNAILDCEDIKWSSQAMVAQISGISWVVGQAARFNDLVILPRPYGETAGPDAVAVLEAALFSGDVPVLVFPGAAKAIPGKKVVIGWNDSAGALRATKAALPFLQGASTADISVINPPHHDEDQADLGSELSKFLTRHDVNVTVSVLAGTMPKLSESLVQHAVDEQADMIVIGAYGHSRFREAILGGATRDMLEGSTLPVLMAH